MTSRFKLGDQVILGRHDPDLSVHSHSGIANWDRGMEKYVGKKATLNHQFPIDVDWGYVWGVDIDGGRFAWHEKNMMPGDTIHAIRVVPKSNGASCSKCREFNNYAEPNMPDGTYKCYSCRH